MNRKQRRSKPKKRTVIDYDLFQKRFDYLIESNIHRPLTQDEINNFHAPWQAAINSLRFGMMTEEEYFTLSKMLILGTELAGLIGQYDKSGKIIEAGNGYQKYGNLLGIIGDRHTETGKYIAAGDELNALEEAKNTNLELLELANYAHVIKAARQTGLIVGSMLRTASRKQYAARKNGAPHHTTA
ncbi:MAG: hypothetical protein AB7U63_13590 [Porticoccaceae bacterium]